MEKINKVLDLVERSRVLRNVKDDILNEIIISHGNEMNFLEEERISLLKRDLANCEKLLENINLEISKLTFEIGKVNSEEFTEYQIEELSEEELPF